MASSPTLEQMLPGVMESGLITTKAVIFTNAASCDLPTGTTLNGVTLASIANVTSTATSGASFSVTNTGVYAGVGMNQVIANSLTTGVANLVSITSATTGIGITVKATQATLTTGRYFSANNASVEVFGIGLNGHIISTVSADAPTIAVTTQNGITAAAITAGGTDTCGIITTTGTSTDSTLLTITFGKTYTTAPKAVLLSPVNAAAAMPNSGYYVSSVSATAFQITVVTGGTYAATPSWRYLVIA